MSTPLTIVARIEAYPDQVELLKTELQKLVEPTLREPGCMQYDLHQDNLDPAIFLFYENWENRELWQAHMNNRHIADFARATDGAIADFSLFEMTRV